MGVPGGIGLALLQLALGLGMLACLKQDALAAMSRLEKLAAALLLGVGTSAYAALLLLFAGVPLSGWWCAGFALAALLLLLGRAHRAPLLLKSPQQLPVCTLKPLGALIGVATLALFSWTALAAFFLPTLDFDGLAIWSLRVRVLLNERSFYSETFLDPARFTPMPRHPYFLPVLEACYCLAWGGFHWAAVHLPHLLLYLAYLGLSWAAARSLAPQGPRRLALGASLVLLPAMAVFPWLEGAREPLIGIFGLGAVWYLARWQERPDTGLLLLGAGFALAAQQIKVEGLPLAVGFAAGAFLTALGAPPGERPRRLRQALLAAAGMLLLALPWYLVRKRLLPATHDYVFTSGFGSDFGARLRALPKVGYLLFSELFLRPELYGVAPLAALAGLFSGWKRTNRTRRLALLAAPVLCLAGILAIYAVRQGLLGAERNVTFSRRMICFLPALILAALYLPPGSRPESSSPRNSG